MGKSRSSCHSHIIFEQLEPRLLLSADLTQLDWLELLDSTLVQTELSLSADFPIGPGYPPPLGAGPINAPPQDPDNAVFVPHYDQVPDYDWWYGCSPTTGGMHSAWWDVEVKLPSWTDDLEATTFPGDPQNWLFDEYPSYGSETFAVPDFANGVVNGWPHIYDFDTYEGHVPDSIGDFMLTVEGGSYPDNIMWGMENFMGWDDPRTPQNESWLATIGTLPTYSFPDYQAEIDAGRPVHLWLTGYDADGLPVSGHSVLGVGYYLDPDSGEEFYELYTTWNWGLEEWAWAGEEVSDLTWVPDMGAMAMDLSLPLTGLSGYLAISHTDIDDLTVEIGLGDPASPDWYDDTFWTPTGQHNANLVLTDIDLSGALDYLGTAENWYLKVSDGTGGNVGEIMDFQIRYDGQQWFTPDIAVEIEDGTAVASYAYLTSGVVGEIHGTKWDDLNGDGIRDGGEPGLADWQIFLDANSNGVLDWTDGNGNSEWDEGEGERFTVTDVNGDYSFISVTLGTYTVSEVMQAGWVQTTPGGSYIGMLAGQTVEGLDFGNYLPGQISGLKWNDLDQNGSQDGGELGLADWTIFLDDNSNGQLDWTDADDDDEWDEDEGERFTTTDADGNYSFTGLLPGSYVVAEVLELGWVQTLPDSPAYYEVEITSNSDIQDRDFGNYLPDLPDLVDGGSAYSDFSPAVVSPGSSWSVSWRITNSGAANAGEFVVDFYASVDNDMATSEDNYYLGSVTVLELDAGIYTGIVLSLSSFPAIPAGDYYVGVVIDSGESVIESSEGNNTAVDDSYPLRVPGIRGLKWADANSDGVQDLDEPGIEGFVIYLDENQNGILDFGDTSTTTDANGEYSFTNLSSDTYVVAEVVQSGWTQSYPAGDGTHTVVYTAGTLVEDTDFGNRPNVNLIDDGDLFSRFDPGTVISPGSSWDIWWDIRNEGTADAGEFQVAFYASVDDDMSTTGDNYYLGSLIVPGLTAGSYIDLNLSLLSFPEVPAGSYYVGIVIDVNNEVAEYNEADNIAFDYDYYPLVVINQPDLAEAPGGLGDFTPTVVVPGDSWQTSWTIQNQGLADADSFWVNFYASTNANITVFDELLGRVQVYDGLAAGESTEVNLSMFNFPVIPTGNYYVGMIIDSDNSVIESDETNNVAVSSTYPLLVPGISGTVWHDVNADGAKGAGEPGLPGWIVYMDSNDNGQPDIGIGEPMTFTDPNGDYSFAGLETGDYVIREVPMVFDTWQQTGPAAGAHTVAFTTGEMIDDIDFFNAMPSRLDGLVWHDLDGNGEFDEDSEFGLAGWTVYVDANSNGTLDMGEISTLTDGAGLFYFKGLMPDLYFIRTVQEPGWLLTTPVLGYELLSATSAHIYEANFGECRPAWLSGRKWHDLNADGIQGPNEPGLENWIIYLDENENSEFDEGETYTTTDGDGSYIFDNLMPGHYVVREVLPEGWSQSFPLGGFVEVDLESDGSQSGVDFGNYQDGEIRGIKWHDIDADGVYKPDEEPGLFDWTIWLDDGIVQISTVTDADGYYVFTDVAPGTYTVSEELQTGWLQSAPGTLTYTVTITSGGIAENRNFGNYQPGEISGIKWDDLNDNGIRDFNELGLEDWTIFLDQNENGILDIGETFTLTDATGNYSFTGLIPGRYYVAEVLQDDWAQSAPTEGSYEVAISSGDVIEDQDFGNYQLGQIYGTKWEDLNGDGIKDAGEPGLAGWVIFLDQNSNDELNWIDDNGNSEWDEGEGERFVTTDVDGNYSFTGLDLGQYTVAEVLKDDWLQSAPEGGNYTVTITSGLVVEERDFGNFQVGQISGLKWEDLNGDGIQDHSELGLAGWTIFLDENSDDILNWTDDVVVNGQWDEGEGERFTTTDVNGTYTFAELYPGNYTVAEVLQTGWVQSFPTDGTHLVELTSGESESDIDFGNVLASVIRGSKWSDLDADGLWDAEEPALQGWTISLFLDSNENGQLDPDEAVTQRSTVTGSEGEYEFDQLLPGTYVVSEVQQDGWAQTAPAGGNYQVIITAGLTVEDKDFANVETGEIRGYKWEDLNANGLWDDGEGPLENWTIYLDINNNGLFDPGEGEPSAVTDENGEYVFDDLLPDVYYVAEVLQAGWVQSTPELSSHEVSVTAGLIIEDINFGNWYPGTIQGIKWHDENFDGVKDAGELGLADWQIFLDTNSDGILDWTDDVVVNGQWDEGEGERFTVTDVNGEYNFTGLQPGDYTVAEVSQDGWVQTWPEAEVYVITLISSQVETDDNFGNWEFEGAVDDDGVVVDEDSGANVIDVMDNDVIPHPGSVTVESVTQPEHGQSAVFGGGTAVTYQPDPDYYGPDSFTYTLTDGNRIRTATVTITVTNLPDPPTAHDDVANVVQYDDAIPVDVLSNDTYLPDPPETLTIVAVTQGAIGEVVITGSGTGLTYDPEGDYFGSDTFTYTIMDEDGLTSTATVNVTIDVSPGIWVEIHNPAVPTAYYTDIDGTGVAITIRGGSALLNFVGPDPHASILPNKVLIYGSQAQLAEIILVDTTARSSLTFIVKGGDGLATVGKISGSTPLGRLSGNKVNLFGEGIIMTGAGYIGSTYLHDILNGADIIMPATGVARGISIRANQLYADSDIVLGSYLRSLYAKRWVGSLLTAPWAVNISIRGDSLITGDFGADLNLTGIGLPLRRKTLNRISVSGTVQGGTWNVNGDVGSIWALAIADGWTLNASGDVRSLYARNGLGGVVSALWFNRIYTRGNLSAEISASGRNAAGYSIMGLQAGSVEDVSLVVPGGIRTIMVTEWVDTDGFTDTIEAAWLDSLRTRGRRANLRLGLPAIAGDFEADLILNGVGLPLRRKTLGNAYIAGSIACTWDIDGDSGNIRAGATKSSWELDAEGYVNYLYTTNDLGGMISALRFNRIYTRGDLAADITANGQNTVGVSIGNLTVKGTAENVTVRSVGSMLTLRLGRSDGSDFLAGVSGSASRHAADHGDFVNSSAKINSIVISGLRMPAGIVLPRCVLDSNFSAASIGSVSLINVEFDNSGTDFGLWARNAGGGSGIIGTEIRSVRHTDKLTGETWSWKPTPGELPGEVFREDNFVAHIL